MKTLKLTTLIAFLALALSVPTAALAGGHTGGSKVCPLSKKSDCCKSKCSKKKDKKKSLKKKFFKKAHFFLDNKEGIGLSEDQVKQVREIKVATKKALVLKKAEIEATAIDIKYNLYYKDSIDVAAVQSMVDKKYELKKEKMKMLVEAYANLKGVLSDSQMKKAIAIWEEKSGKK